jgi:ABC-type long-subunit fatty acid transport system fused permease/ATPase subunit
LRFFIILLVARLPWIIGSVAVGSTIHLEQYGSAIIISVISVIAFIFGYIYKDKLVQIFSKTENETGK